MKLPENLFRENNPRKGLKTEIIALIDLILLSILALMIYIVITMKWVICHKRIWFFQRKAQDNNAHFVCNALKWLELLKS